MKILHRGGKKKFIRFILIVILFAFTTSQVFAQTLPRRSNQVTSDIQSLVNQGREAYNLGRYQEAVNLLEQGFKLTANNYDKPTQSVILSNLSLAYQQLGDWETAQKQIAASLKLLENSQSSKIYAQSLDIQSRLWYMHGKPETALKSLQQSAAIYTNLGDEVGKIANTINQVQVLQALGLQQQAYKQIEQIQQKLSTISDSTVKIQGYLSLGSVLRAIGDLKRSHSVLSQSLALADNLPPSTINHNIKNATLLSLANTLVVKGNLERDSLRDSSAYRISEKERDYGNTPWQCQQQLPNTALKSYGDAAIKYQQVLAATPSSPSTHLQTQVNYLSLLVKTGEFSTAQEFWQKIKLSELPNSRQSVYAHINIAKNLACIAQNFPNQQQEENFTNSIDNLLISAIENANQLHDTRALAYAIGNRAGFYEYLATQQRNSPYLQTSQKLTQKALLLTQSITAPDIAYQWEWQMGRIFAAQGNNKEAVKYYKAAVESLNIVRSDLLSINSDVQFSYRDNVEPVYRGLVDLLLRFPAQASNDNLTQAIENIDALQLAELQNFLKCNLGQLLPISRKTNNNPNKNIDTNTAFIYPIILEDRLEVIYKLPGERLEHHTQQIKRREVQQTIQHLRSAIFSRNVSKIREKSQELYSWLIAPLEPYLQQQADIKTNIKSLVFTLDGELRNIPMGLLYDKTKNEYLVQKDYAIALLPNSQLFNLNPQTTGKFRVLAAGISEKQENIAETTGIFNQLNIDELQQIAKLVPSKLLINEQFTQDNLSKQMRTGEFSVVHIATHGNFSSNPEETYLLAYKQLIKARDLDNLLRNNQVNSNTIKLLVLSACKTAEGDNRAVLGFAGLALRAGANSTLSTLWQVNDDSASKLMVQFYTELKKSGVSKAEALHRAQKALMAQPEYQNPYFWAAYTLVGNWF
ncbi:CHAT domain-containing protein [Calothrix sp. UHCC 0171]|uniref:CHAT domain-containing protein n=1 Tax=Calothrix sp. UHCC 0171 TaxID=3110245 RepID=UPI002B2169A4|nr:CHAT domain-containing protein [Calothrix sp. UHCC 0171]MEA5573019.1 CHAT domain-containing protein [Calothrix sp. UHCC 0171]